MLLQHSVFYLMLKQLLPAWLQCFIPLPGANSLCSTHIRHQNSGHCLILLTTSLGICQSPTLSVFILGIISSFFEALYAWLALPRCAWCLSSLICWLSCIFFSVSSYLIQVLLFPFSFLPYPSQTTPKMVCRQWDFQVRTGSQCSESELSCVMVLNRTVGQLKSFRTKVQKMKDTCRSVMLPVYM